MSIGSGESNWVGKQSCFDRKYDEHSQPHDNVGMGEGVLVGPTKVAGWEGGSAGRVRCGAVVRLAVGNPACSGASTYCSPSALNTKPSRATISVEYCVSTDGKTHPCCIRWFQTCTRLVCRLSRGTHPKTGRGGYSPRTGRRHCLTLVPATSSRSQPC